MHASTQQLIYTIGFTISDLGLVTIHYITLDDSGTDEGGETWGDLGMTGTAIMAAFLASRGIWDFVVWVIAQVWVRIENFDGKERSWKDCTADLDIREQLRYELVLYTAQGIFDTTRSGIEAEEKQDSQDEEPRRVIDDSAQGTSLTHPALFTEDGSQRSADPLPADSPIVAYNKDKKPLTGQDADNLFGLNMGRSSSFSFGTKDAARKSSTGGIHPNFTFQGRKVDFYTYKDDVFKDVRKSLNVDDNEFASSFAKIEEMLLNREANSFSEIVSSGASGSYFYFTPDKKYIVKTVDKNEKNELMHLCSSYQNHCVENPETMIHYYGCHSIRLPLNTAKVYFVVMKNFIPSSTRPDVMADLKGATTNRRRFIDPISHLNAQKQLNQLSHVDGTLLDLDWRDLKLPNRQPLCVNIGPKRRTHITEVLVKDLKWLADQELMDYSILLGICFPKQEPVLAELPPAMGDDFHHSSRSPTGSRAFSVTLDEEIPARPSFASDASVEGSSSKSTRGSGRGSGGTNYVLSPDVVVTPSADFEDDRGHQVLQHVGRDGAVYYIGMIDILEKWNGGWAAQGCIMHFVLKYILLGLWQNPRGMTALEPMQYAQRFEEFFVDQIIRSDALLNEAPPPGPPTRHMDASKWRPWW